MKRLRGTLLDVFRWDPDRRLERALIEEYSQLATSVLDAAAVPYGTKVELAASALDIRGYRTVKERNVAAWRKRVAELQKPAPLCAAEAAE
jgi:indolepyruvate ferredoxin oxidoreductase